MNDKFALMNHGQYYVDHVKLDIMLSVKNVWVMPSLWHFLNLTLPRVNILSICFTQWFFFGFASFFFYPVCQDWLACTFCSSLCLCGIKSHPEQLTPDLDVLTPLFYSWGSIRFKRTTGLANKGPVGGDGPHIKHAPQAEEWVNVRGESVPG